MIREVFTHPANFGKVSFPTVAASGPGVRPYMKGSALRYDDEEETEELDEDTEEVEELDTTLPEYSAEPDRRRGARRGAVAADERGGADGARPRRSPATPAPTLALLERFLPAPPDNVLDAELAAFAAPGDTVLDPWAGTGLDRPPRGRAGHARRCCRPESVRADVGDGPAHRPGASGARCRLRSAGELQACRRSPTSAPRGAICLALRGVSQPGGGRPVHLAPRRGCTGTEDLPMRRLRRIGRRCRGPGRAGRPGRPCQAGHRAAGSRGRGAGR